jgi:putative glutamine amidotransferase
VLIKSNGRSSVETSFTPVSLMRQVPLVGLPSDLRQIGPHPFHAVGDKYLRAAVEFAGVFAVGLPALLQPLAPEAIVAELDGLLLTGSPSNIEAHHYGLDPAAGAEPYDPARDASTLPLIRAAVAAGLPVLGLCRGFQEINVALGGTLHPRVHEVSGLNDHREDKQMSLDTQYAVAHAVRLEPGGLLASLAGSERAVVNSLHGQGIDRLAPGLRVEARAEDGLIEAFRGNDDAGFLLAVQWHPEWKPAEHPFYAATLRAFGDACRRRLTQKT